jgi:hypothetical protein
MESRAQHDCAWNGERNGRLHVCVRLRRHPSWVDPVNPTTPPLVVDIVDHFNLLGQGKTPNVKVYLRGKFTFPAYEPFENPVVRGPTSSAIPSETPPRSADASKHVDGPRRYYHDDFLPSARAPSAPTWIASLPVPAAAAFAASPRGLDADLQAYLSTLGFTGRMASTLEARLGRRVDHQVAEVGRMLWFDPIGGLHGDNTCGGCHSPTNGFGDTQSIAIGIDNNGVVGPGRTGPRNQRRSPMVINRRSTRR